MMILECFFCFEDAVVLVENPFIVLHYRRISIMIVI